MSLLKGFSPKALETNRARPTKVLRGDQKKVSFYLPAHLARMVRIQAVEEETSMSDLVSQILEGYGREHKLLN
ncbi:MAG: hypothetical protein P1V51_19920 [Deltaproteobacteria bacterium]|nr:hypothetical protein [Deltaproteobacteria bacterium]